MEQERLLKLKLSAFVVQNALYYRALNKPKKLPLRVIRAAIKHGHKWSRN